MGSLTIYFSILVFCKVGVLNAGEYCYNSGSYTGYCSDNEYCCNSGRSCCEDYIDGGAIAGIVITCIVVAVFCVICTRIIYIKKYRSTPIAVAPIVSTTTVQNTNTQMYQPPPMSYPPPYGANPAYPPPQPTY